MDAATTLKKHDLKVTKIRLAILNALGNTELAKPYAELQAMLSEFDRTTLYRTLLALMEKGLIHKALEENGESYYALCSDCSIETHVHDHMHFKCITCGVVQCLDLPKRLKFSAPGIHIDSIEVVAKGQCSNCN